MLGLWVVYYPGIWRPCGDNNDSLQGHHQAGRTLHQNIKGDPWSVTSQVKLALNSLFYQTSLVSFHMLFYKSGQQYHNCLATCLLHEDGIGTDNVENIL